MLEFQDVFVSPDGKVSFTDWVNHVINTEDPFPMKFRYQWKSFFEKEHIGVEVEKLTTEGQIRPSKSPWEAPVILVKKKDDSLHFCIDYGRLNAVMKDAYLLRHIEECLDMLNGL